MQFTFDWTINVAAVLTMLGAVGVVLSAIIRYGRQCARWVAVQEFRTNTMWTVFVRDYPADLEAARRRDPTKGRWS